MSKADFIARELLGVMNTQQKKNTADDPMEIGRVTNLNPLTIEVEGLPLYENNLYVNKYLLAWDEEVNITTSTNDNHNHTITIIHHPSKLQVGYYVGLYGLEWNKEGKTYQKYLLLNVIN